MYILNLSEIDFCKETAPVWQFVGYIFFALKILVPLIIIILGIIDLAKVIISSKDDELPSALKKLGIRLIIGIAIFLIPSLINAVFSMIKSDSISDSKECRDCLLSPFSVDCSDSIKSVKSNNYNDSSDSNKNSIKSKEDRAREWAERVNEDIRSK